MMFGWFGATLVEVSTMPGDFERHSRDDAPNSRILELKVLDGSGVGAYDEENPSGSALPPLVNPYTNEPILPRGSSDEVARPSRASREQVAALSDPWREVVPSGIQKALPSSPVADPATPPPYRRFEVREQPSIAPPRTRVTVWSVTGAVVAAALAVLLWGAAAHLTGNQAPWAAALVGMITGVGARLLRGRGPAMGLICVFVAFTAMILGHRMVLAMLDQGSTAHFWGFLSLGVLMAYLSGGVSRKE
jgi:hypothetical protein